MNEALRDRARGRWHGLLPSLGVDSRYLTGKHTGCPICRDGKDRFRFDDKDGTGTWICSRCGAGDGISLVMQVNGWSFKNAAVEIEKLIGCVPFRPSSEVRSDGDQRRVMNASGVKARPVETGDPVARYLLARTGLVTFPACIRTAARLCHTADVTSFAPGNGRDGTGADGKPVNIHRTYLTLAGTKAPLEEPRRLMPGKVPHGIGNPFERASGVLGIAEGIETAFSATALFDVPCWAVINKAIMSKWIVPADVRELIIFADNDASYAGQAAAFELAHRVKKAGLSVSVRVPADRGHRLERRASATKHRRVNTRKEIDVTCPKFRFPKSSSINGRSHARALNTNLTAEYADAMKAGAVFPPLTVFHDGKVYWLADGFHRHYAATSIGSRDIACIVKPGRSPRCDPALLPGQRRPWPSPLRRGQAASREGAPRRQGMGNLVGSRDSAAVPSLPYPRFPDSRGTARRSLATLPVSDCRIPGKSLPTTELIERSMVQSRR